jgi:hypothetical protein
MKSVQEVISAIHSAFKDVTREDAITTHEAEAMDAYSDRKSARLLDTDKRWRDVPDSAIEECQDVFCYLDPKGFRYYIPAYMIWSLQNYESNSAMSTIYALSASNRDRFGLLDPAQREAICAFLEYVAESYDDDSARMALDRYWRKVPRSKRRKV